MFEIAEPQPAPLFGDCDPVHAELAELGPQLAREAVAAVDLVGPRRDPRSGEAAHALAQHVRRLSEGEIEPAETTCQHGSWSFANQVWTEYGRAGFVLQ